MGKEDLQYQPSEIDLLLQKYYEEEGFRESRMESLVFLSGLGVSQPVIDLVNACLVQHNLMWSSTPRHVLEMADLVPLISRVVKRTLADATRAGIAVGVELTTVSFVLETVISMDRGNEYGEGNDISPNQENLFIGPLRTVLPKALEYTRL